MEDNDVVMTNEKRATNETSRQKSFQVIDLENNEEDEIVCIAVLNSTSNTSYHDEDGPVSSSVPNNRNCPRVIDVEDDIEVINVDCDNDERLNKPLTRSEPRVIDVEDEIDDKFDDISYTLRVDDSPVSNEPHIIDLEENSKDIENQMSEGNPDIACIDNLPGNHAVHDCDSQTEETHTTQIVEAMVHEDPNSSTVSNVSEIDDYDARMRQHFQLDLDSSSSKNAGDLTFTSSCFDELNESAGNLSGVGDAMECDSGTDSDIIEINDEDTNDDCIITSTELPSVSKETSSGTKGVFKTVATIDVELHDEKKKRKKITETVDEIFYRMMPSCVPGVLSLCASEPHCLPTNVRPFKFCYFYHVTPHIVVKEIDKNQFFRIKDQMLIAKKVIQPCTCLSHPLNQNASKLTLLTNPQSLFHRSQCYFAQSSRRDRSNRPKRRGPRRLTYQVTFCRVPRKREGKDFKDWADVVIKRRQNSSLASNSDLEDSKIEHQPFVCKSEADSWGDSKENIITSPIILKTGS